jgi:hypothetical protein
MPTVTLISLAVILVVFIWFCAVCPAANLDCTVQDSPASAMRGADDPSDNPAWAARSAEGTGALSEGIGCK